MLTYILFLIIIDIYTNDKSNIPINYNERFKAKYK